MTWTEVARHLRRTRGWMPVAHIRQTTRGWAVDVWEPPDADDDAIDVTGPER